MKLKLHIGCGDDIREGYINIDAVNSKADLRIPIQELAYPDGIVERIEGYMILEHLSPADARVFLRKAYCMLEAGGMLVLEVPDLEKVCRLILALAEDPEHLERGVFGLRGIFGEPNPHMTIDDYHKWGYTPSMAEKMIRDAGFSHVTILDGTSHCFPLRDMRIEAIK